MFTEKEIGRYNRHLILPGFGMEAQEKLKNAKVLVIGAGGLGCPVLLYLTAAGVGEIGIVDFDVVDESNLQRQILYAQSDIGNPKADAAAAHLSLQNPFVKFRKFKIKLTSKNALQLFEEYDLIIDGSDNFATRYLVNDACFLLNKPLIYGSIFKFQGQVSVFNALDKSGNRGPTYRCLFPKIPSSGSVPNCSEIGVLGVLPGIIGTLQATEAIKLITGIGELLSGKLFMLDALTMKSQIISIEKNEVFSKMGPDSETQFIDTDYDMVCGVFPSSKKVKSITCESLQKIISEGKEIQLLDVRELNEGPYVEELAGIHIPLGDILNQSEIISKENLVVVYCRSGVRSQQAIEKLEDNYQFSNLYNLEGGVLEWLNQTHKK